MLRLGNLIFICRNYINKIGVRLNIPLIDAGTLGYFGNVTTIIPHVTKCYSCEPKVAPQNVFPVCTIRMRPEKPIHCIVWAKMLFEAFFGPDNN
jgi:ubiquitin-like 1-activating enzyme E1 B